MVWGHDFLSPIWGGGGRGIISGETGGGRGCRKNFGDSNETEPESPPPPHTHT